MISRHAKRSAHKKVLVSKSELNQLLFWATVGVQNSKTGSYWECIEDTVRDVGRILGRFFSTYRFIGPRLSFRAQASSNSHSSRSRFLAWPLRYARTTWLLLGVALGISSTIGKFI